MKVMRSMCVTSASYSLQKFLGLIICLQEACINIKEAFCFAQKGKAYVRLR